MKNKNDNELGWDGLVMIVSCLGIAVVCLYAFFAGM